MGVAIPSGGRAAHNRQYQGIWISATPVIISLQGRLWIKRRCQEFKGMEQDFTFCSKRSLSPPLTL
jgi:hypothetical protein